MMEQEQQDLDTDFSMGKHVSRFTKGVALFILTCCYFVVLAKVPGESDILFLIFWFTTCITIFHQTYKIKSGLRSIQKHVFEERSILYAFFAKKSLIQFFFSLFLAVLVSMSFLVTLKLLVLKHGFIQTLVTMLIPIIFIQLTKGQRFSFSIEKNMKGEDSQETIADITNLFFKATLMAFFISLLFSVLDTLSFYQSDLSFFNFAEYAEAHAIPLNDGGHYARALINISVIIDTFNTAVINELINALDFEKSSLSPQLFFFVTLSFNLLKLLPFCIAYVFIVMSLQNKILEFSVLAYLKLKSLVSVYFSKKTAGSLNKE